MGWFGSIFSARESNSGESPVEGSDGNYTYSNGTYGQSDYTVRERSDGNFDVYVKSDSGKGHSHDVIDKYGNLIASYHDYLFDQLSQFTSEDLDYISSISNNELVKDAANELKNQKKLILK